jgi:prolyl 4-hydroxylase
LTALERAAGWSEEARSQLALLNRMDIDRDGGPRAVAAKSPLSDRPRAWTVSGLLTQAECGWLVRQAEPYLQPSVVVDPTTGRMVPNPVRKSDGATFGVLQEDAVVSAINRRIACLTGTALDSGEPLQVLRYRPGDEYKAHFDALPPGGNQRIATVLVYLNDGYEGGETAFLRTGASFRGRKGDALLFLNVQADGAPDPMSLHAGLPVRRGEKLIATRWIRERAFTYPAPEPATGSRFD